MAMVDGGIVSTDRLDEVESAAGFADAACTAGRTAVDRGQAAVALARAELEKNGDPRAFLRGDRRPRHEIVKYATPSPPAVPVPPAIDLLDPLPGFSCSAPMDEGRSRRASGPASRPTDRRFPPRPRGVSRPRFAHRAFRGRPRGAEPHRRDRGRVRRSRFRRHPAARHLGRRRSDPRRRATT